MADIPINFGELHDAVNKNLEAVRALLTEFGMPTFLRDIIAGAIGIIMWLVFPVLILALKVVLAVGTWFATSELGVFTKVRTENASDFNQVIAAALSELLGYEINPDQFSAGQGPQGLNDRIASIGRALHDLLRSEFATSSEITPDQGRQNAEKFSGFAINFGVGSAFISILTEACSLGMLKEFRELGVETAQALGLGRLQRLAMQPLIRNAIQQPSDLYYRSLLRPDRLSEAQVVQAVRSGDMSADDARQQLAEKGYREKDIDILLDQLSLKVQATELSRLIRYSVISQQQAIDGLKTQGMTQEDAANYLKSIDESRADTQLTATLSDLETARVDGFLSQDEYVRQLQDLEVGTEETSAFLRKVARKLERPRKTLTFAELKNAYTYSDVDLTYVDNWLQNAGYNDQDNVILTLELIRALQTEDAKAAARKMKADALRAAGKPVPPTLLLP